MGDIGPKFGYMSKDNGFMKFTNFEIPYESLLGKFSYIKNNMLYQRGNPKIIYASMMKVRIFLLGTSSLSLLMGVTIATRYSYLRKQFLNENKQEVPIIEYQL